VECLYVTLGSGLLGLVQSTPLNRWFFFHQGPPERYTLTRVTDDFPETLPLSENDLLFLEHGEDISTIACVNFGNAEHGYAEGFLKAADHLVAILEETGVEQDYFVYPIVLCYRRTRAHLLRLMHFNGLCRSSVGSKDHSMNL